MKDSIKITKDTAKVNYPMQMDVSKKVSGKTMSSRVNESAGATMRHSQSKDAYSFDACKLLQPPP